MPGLRDRERDRERGRDFPSERVPTCAFPFARSCSLENPSSKACGKNVEVWRWELRKVLVVKIKISIESCLLVLCIVAVAQKVLLVKIRIARELLWSRARQTLFETACFSIVKTVSSEKWLLEACKNCMFWKKNGFGSVLLEGDAGKHVKKHVFWIMSPKACPKHCKNHTIHLEMEAQCISFSKTA